MAKFLPALQLVLKHEGGLVDSIADSGGITNFGISYAFYKKSIKPDATAEDIKRLNVSEAEDIYKRYFWDRADFESIESQAICNRLFDLSVNCGLAHAVGIIQRAVNACNGSHLVTDGQLGGKTIDAINSIPFILNQCITSPTEW